MKPSMYQFDKMDATKKQEYDQYLENLQVSKSMLEIAKLEGKQEGRQEGVNEIIIDLHEDGFPSDRIAKVSKLVGARGAENPRGKRQKQVAIFCFQLGWYANLWPLRWNGKKYPRFPVS